MKHTFSFSYFLLSLASFAVAQPNALTVCGVVLSKETKEPVPFASVSITGTTLGTATNERGEFCLTVRKDDSTKDVKISSIGFTSKTILLDSIKEIAAGSIELDPDSKMLNEIVVTEERINPVLIIRSALDSIDKNYENAPFNLELHSEIVVSNFVTQQDFRIESLIIGYYKGYATSANKKFEIRKKRSFGDNPLSASGYSFWPTLEMHRADLIADPAETGILNAKNLDKFDFTYHGIHTYDTDTVYHIEYNAPTPTKKITGYSTVPKVYRGTIYITISSNAIVKHDLETDQFSHSIIYRKVNEKYFPYSIRGERKLTGENAFYSIVNLIRVTNTLLEDVKIIDYSTNEFQNLAELPESKEQWDH